MPQLSCVAQKKEAASDPRRPNILMIVVDDLRTNLGCYGDKIAITPNIDSLAQSGTTFNAAYCQQAVCGPSRASFLTGLRPDTTGIYNFQAYHKKIPDAISLPKAFFDAGYQTITYGKLDHASPEKGVWSIKPNTFFRPRYTLPHNLKNQKLKMDAVEVSVDDDLALADGRIAQAAVKALETTPKDKPFFLAVGFKKPHLPFCAPKRYWDAYKRSQFSDLTLPNSPKGMPEAAFYNSCELKYRDMPKNISDLKAKQIAELWHGYYATTTYVDTQVGKVLKALKDNGHADNTVILFTSDHGFHLGEQKIWCKATNFELATRVPMMVVLPGTKDDGQRSDALVELVDMYPTLAELCHISTPENIEGVSMLPLLKKPDMPWKKAAFSQFQRPWFSSGRGKPAVMGRAIRTKTHRYVEWRLKKDNSLHAVELYALKKFGDIETHNLAEDPAHAEIRKAHAELLQKGWRHAIPTSAQKK